LTQNVHRYALANNLIDVAPRELHHQDKQGDKEGAGENQQEVPQHKPIQLFYSDQQLHYFASKSTTIILKEEIFRRKGEHTQPTHLTKGQ